MLYCLKILSQNKLRHMFWKSFKMSKYEINLVIIHVNKKEHTVRANYVIVLTMQNAHPYFEWSRVLDTPVKSLLHRLYCARSSRQTACGRCRETTSLIR